MEPNITLTLLMGLPGAGKSSLCKTIVDKINKDSEFKDFSSFYVCYDTLIPLSLQAKFVEIKKLEPVEKGEDLNDMKQDVLKKPGTVEDEGEDFNHMKEDVLGKPGTVKTGEDFNNMKQDVLGKPGTVENEGADWKSARRGVFDKIDRLVGYLKAKEGDSTILNVLNDDKGVRNSPNVVVLLDDNFYYRSMRYEFYQLARKHTVGYLQVYVDVSTEVAVERNSKRVDKVPTAVVLDMAQKFEVPQPFKISWESSTFVVSAGNEKIVEGEGLSDLKEIEGIGACERSTSFLDGLMEMLKKCMASPVPPAEDNIIEKEEARLICSQNVVHQSDLYLRSLVGKVIKEWCASKNKESKKEYASRVNAARQDIMSSIRKGLLLFPPDIAEAIGEDNREVFETFIKTEFDKSFDML